MTIKPFAILEEYRTQGHAAAVRRLEYQTKVEEAKQTFETAKASLNAIIGEEITSGVDAKAAKTAARKAVEQADKDVAHAVEEERQANIIFSRNGGDIRETDVVKAYIYEYVPTVRAEEMPAIKARMAQGQALILSAMSDFYELKRDYHELVDPLKSLDNTAKNSGQQDAYYSIPNPFEDHRTAGFDQYEFGRLLTDSLRELPAGVEYIEKAFETEGN